jgi:hypothetical protein
MWSSSRLTAGSFSFESKICPHKSTNRQRNELDLAPAVPMLFPLTLAGSAAGGVTVVTGRNCYGEAAAQAEASIVRHGPRGTAARDSADLSGEVRVAATITVSGNCRAASRINFKGRPGPRGGARLPRHPKRVALR